MQRQGEADRLVEAALEDMRQPGPFLRIAQIGGRGIEIDRRADIFAIGICLFELLTGERLFVGETDFAVLEKVRNAVVPSPSELNPNVPEAARVFAPIPRDPLPFPSMLIASTSDPLCSVERAVEFATCWGSDFHLAGDAGHINVESGHGPWPEGLVMFTRLMQRLK